MTLRQHWDNFEMTLGQLWIFLGPLDDCMFPLLLWVRGEHVWRPEEGPLTRTNVAGWGSLMLSFWVIWWLLASRPQASINMRPRWPLTCRATQLSKYKATQWSTTACTCTVEYCGTPYSTWNNSGILWNTLNYLGVPWITLEYLELPKNTVEYIRLPRTTLEYLKLL